MLTAYIPQSFYSESKYTLSVLLKDVTITYEVYDGDFIILKGVDGEFKFILPDLEYREMIKSHPDSYLKRIGRRQTLELNSNSFHLYSVYYPDDLKEPIKNETVYIDLVYTCFLLLTNKLITSSSNTDFHNRIPDSGYLIIQSGLERIAIVDEIKKFLLQIIAISSPSLPQPTSTYTPTLTIDVDELYKWKAAKDFPIWAWNHLKKGKPSRIFHDLFSLSKTLLNRKKDPYNNLEEMISLALAKNIDVILFLKLPAKKVDKYDRSIYRPKNLVDALESKFSGKITYGLHPQYKHYTQAEELKKEKEQLETDLGFEVKHIRQHFLRFKTPDTWQAQLKAGFKLDSTLGFSEKGGFKCGTCHPFPIYDAERKKAAELWEQPLLLMETPYLNRNAGKQLLSDLEHLTSEVKKHRGNNTILWHNSSFVYPEDRALFKKAIKIISS